MTLKVYVPKKWLCIFGLSRYLTRVKIEIQKSWLPREIQRAFRPFMTSTISGIITMLPSNSIDTNISFILIF